MNEDQIRELAEIASLSRSNEDRIHKLEDKQELLHEMNKNIAELVVQTKYTQVEVSGLKTDMEVIKSKPNKIVDAVIGNSLTAIVGALIGALMALILL